MTEWIHIRQAVRLGRFPYERRDSCNLSAGQEMSCFYVTWTLITVFTRSLLPLIPVLSQIISVLTRISYFLEIHFNIIIPFTPRSYKFSLSLTFSDHYACFLSSMRAAFPADLSFVDFITVRIIVIWGSTLDQISRGWIWKSWWFSLCSFV
jgi:hypothetical protein